jgi:hypothetical protein
MICSIATLKTAAAEHGAPENSSFAGEFAGGESRLAVMVGWRDSVLCQEPVFRHVLPILGTFNQACPLQPSAEHAYETILSSILRWPRSAR